MPLHLSLLLARGFRTGSLWEVARRSGINAALLSRACVIHAAVHVVRVTLCQRCRPLPFGEVVCLKK